MAEENVRIDRSQEKSFKSHQRARPDTQTVTTEKNERMDHDIKEGTN